MNTILTMNTNNEFTKYFTLSNWLILKFNLIGTSCLRCLNNIYLKINTPIFPTTRVCSNQIILIHITKLMLSEYAQMYT